MSENGGIRMSTQELLTEFFTRDLSHVATRPLREGVQIAMEVDGEAFTLVKKGNIQVESGTASDPDLSFTVPKASLEKLVAEKTHDIGEMGISIAKLMVERDPALKIGMKVHTGFLDLAFKGYLGVLALGGATLMGFLASQGLSGMGKIKEKLSKLKE